MVTFAQAQERAERWVNGAAGPGRQREVRVREFDLGFVAWAEETSGAPSGGGHLVIARDSGDTTLWPALPVGEVIAAYEAEYGSPAGAPAPPQQAQSVDLEATSFLLTPPQWLQDAADRAGIRLAEFVVDRLRRRPEQVRRPVPATPVDPQRGWSRCGTLRREGAAGYYHRLERVGLRQEASVRKQP
jgi:hypothetical protein